MGIQLSSVRWIQKSQYKLQRSFTKMITIDVQVPLTIEDQDKLAESYAEDGDGLTFKQYCSKILGQEIRWVLDDRVQRSGS